MTQVLTRSAAPTPEPTRWRHGRPGRLAALTAVARRIGYWRAAAAVIAAGSALRIYHWLSGGSFSQDETSLVISFAHRSLAGLTGRLEYDQMAPIAWLWAEKLAYMVAGPSEQSLRFLPLVAGCLGLVPVAAVARRLLSGPLALVALGVVAGSPQILYYSTQVKQYSAEVALTALLVLLALRADAKPTPRPEAETGRGRVVMFWATAAVAFWFATTSVFTTMTLGGLLVAFAAWRARWRRVAWHGVGGAVAATSLAFMYLVQRPHVADWLAAWWTKHYPGSMAPVGLTPERWLRWTVKCAESLARTAMGVRAAELRVVLMALVVLGAVALLLRLRRTAVLALAPAVVAYLLAMFRLYPFSARLALWVVPLMLIAACAAIDAAARWAWRPRGHWARRTRPVAVVLALALAAGLTWAYAPTIGRRLPHNQLTLYERAEEAIRFVAANRAPGDLVYFGYNTSRVAVWYGPRAGLAWDGLFQPVKGAGAPGRRGP
ncbi:glycosyltransferase family 39 protein [Luedemannella flava]